MVPIPSRSTGIGGIAGMGAPTMVALTLARWLMPGFSCRGLCTVKQTVGDVSWLGCRGDGPERWSAWLTLRRSPWQWWCPFLLVVWTTGVIATGESARSLSMTMTAH